MAKKPSSAAPSLQGAGVAYTPKKNDRVSFWHNGQDELAVVTKVSQGKVHVRLDDLRTGTVPASLVRLSEAPLPDHLKPKSFKKGDRVEFDGKEGVLAGTVVKGGSMVEVFLDGGALKARVPVEDLRPTTVSLPKDDPHPMDAWGVKNRKDFAELRQETPAFSAEITYNGKVVLQASNDGRGGCNRYMPLNGNTYGIVDRLESDAKQWMIDHGMPEERVFEAADAWVEWKHSQAPYGMTAKGMVEELIRPLGDEDAFSPGGP